MQLRKKLHFFREHPHPTNLDEEFPWNLVYEELKRQNSMHKVIWHRCRTGLIGKDDNGKPIPLKKPSEAYASHELLVAPFRNKLCNGHHANHGQVRGSQAKLAQVWTWEEAELVVSGIEALIKHLSSEACHLAEEGAALYDASELTYNVLEHAYPSIGVGPDDVKSRKKGTIRMTKPVEEYDPTDCPGCRRKRCVTDNDHEGYYGDPKDSKYNPHEIVRWTKRRAQSQLQALPT